MSIEEGNVYNFIIKKGDYRIEGRINNEQYGASVNISIIGKDYCVNIYDVLTLAIIKDDKIRFISKKNIKKLYREYTSNYSIAFRTRDKDQMIWATNKEEFDRQRAKFKADVEYFTHGGTLEDLIALKTLKDSITNNLSELVKE